MSTEREEKEGKWERRGEKGEKRDGNKRIILDTKQTRQEYAS